MDQNLIGYLLDALDPDARQEVETALEARPELRSRLERLRAALAPLELDRELPEPPPGLALGALARIAEYRCRPLPDAPLPLPSQRLSPAPRRGFRRADVLAAAALLLLLGGLALPGVRLLWHAYSFRATCANNLRVLWTGLQSYSDFHDGALPKVSETGPQSVAGIFVPILHDAGVLNRDAPLTCPGDDRRISPRSSLSMDDLKDLYSNSDDFQAAVKNLAGSYAYTIGYRSEDGMLQGLRRDSGEGLPVLADRLPCRAFGNSPNHGGDGQNVLYLGGNVRWCPVRTVGMDRDDIYLNRRNEVKAGLDHDDTVLGCSEAQP
jgi:hypothetical protein